MPINQSLPAILRRRAKRLVEDGLYVDEPNFCVALTRAADELQIRQRCATDDEQVAVEMIAQNRQLRHHFEQVVQLVEELPLPLRTKLAFQARVDQLLGSQKVAGEGRGILAIALPPDASRELVEARVRELLDHHWAAVDAATAAAAADPTVQVPASEEGLLIAADSVGEEPVPVSVEAMRAANDTPLPDPDATPKFVDPGSI